MWLNRGVALSMLARWTMASAALAAMQMPMCLCPHSQFASHSHTKPLWARVRVGCFGARRMGQAGSRCSGRPRHFAMALAAGGVAAQRLHDTAGWAWA